MPPRPNEPRAPELPAAVETRNSDLEPTRSEADSPRNGGETSTEPAPENSGDDGWVTLGEAAELAGVSTSAVSKWQRAGKVGSRVKDGPRGKQRLVAINEVRAHAKQGRSARAERVSPAPAEAADERQAETTPSPQQETASTQASGRVMVPPQQEAASTHPSGHVMLPIEAWQRLLEQLGNLHEAGQQHADARERAAKAETTVEFLRERIRELEREVGSGPENPDRPRWWRRAGWSDYDR